jgi:nitroreductase
MFAQQREPSVIFDKLRLFKILILRRFLQNVAIATVRVGLCAFPGNYFGQTSLGGVTHMDQTNRSRHSEFPIHPHFLDRWSPRSFDAKPVNNDTLMTVLEAARWAPSASNEQPWRYIVARTPKEKAAFTGFIHPSNLRWCASAPVLLLVLSAKITGSGRNNRTHAFDAGTSWGYLALEATNQGLIVHAMGGFDNDNARIALEVPEDYELHAVIALGYQGDMDALPEDLQEREQPSQRRPLSESLYAGRFGQSLE